MLYNLHNNPFYVLTDFRICKPQELYAIRFNNCLSLSVILLSTVDKMRISVEFNCQFLFWTIKVLYVILHTVLSSELMALQAHSSQLCPQEYLSLRHVPSEKSALM
jgi:hypothetical protein